MNKINFRNNVVKKIFFLFGEILKYFVASVFITFLISIAPTLISFFMEKFLIRYDMNVNIVIFFLIFQFYFYIIAFSFAHVFRDNKVYMVFILAISSFILSLSIGIKFLDNMYIIFEFNREIVASLSERYAPILFLSFWNIVFFVFYYYIVHFYINKDDSLE